MPHPAEGLNASPQGPPSGPFVDGETEARGGQVSCSGSQSLTDSRARAWGSPGVPQAPGSATAWEIRKFCSHLMLPGEHHVGRPDTERLAAWGLRLGWVCCSESVGDAPGAPALRQVKCKDHLPNSLRLSLGVRAPGRKNRGGLSIPGPPLAPSPVRGHGSHRTP